MWLISLTIPCRAQTAGVCAQVGLQLDENAVITRTAFRATLQLNNNNQVSPMQSVNAQINITDSSGQPATNLFQIQPPVLTGVERIDGTGTIAPGATATIQWLLVPNDEAAPTSATVFQVGGQFSYVLEGNQAQVPLTPALIKVVPDAALDLTYFHQRDVYSDDPFTPQIEPAIPYALVVMIRNRGAGPAQDLTISGGQPQVVSNDKGLLIDFRLIGATLDGTNAPNSLSLDFGQVAPGAIRIATWWFVSSLQGFFQNFSATFQHQDTLGNIHLSTIKSISIHDMERIVQAIYSPTNSVQAYLVNDIPNPKNLPDTLYSSDGTTNPVQVVQQASVSGPPTQGNLAVQLQASMPNGWVYLRVPDPANGQFTLSHVQRSDGVQIPVGTNVWVTDRTFVAVGQPAVRESILHLLDYSSTGNYTLTYMSTNSVLADTNPPVSLVNPLPAQSPPQFAVTWNGHDNPGGSGVAFFDIFVSTNGGPFGVWLQQTALNGAVFSGSPSNSYAFCSVATDRAGNREATHGAPDAQTTVSLFSHPPSLAVIPNQTVAAGSVFTLQVTATDIGSVNNTLTFSLGPGVPPGMTIDSVNGIIQWSTSAANGGSTNLVTVIVQDSSNPPLSDSKTFVLAVTPLNTPPVLAPIANIIVAPPNAVQFRVQATDLDGDNLTYSLATNAPATATINPTNGIFRWTPSRGYADTTNLITVVVTDNGTPPMSVSQTFEIVVLDFLKLTLGTTNLQGGQSASIPVMVDSNDGFTNLAFMIPVPPNTLADFSLISPSPEIDPPFLLDQTSSILVSISAIPGQNLQGTQMLSELSFLARTNVPSAFVSLPPESIIALKPNGQAYRNYIAGPGLVELVEDQSLLLATPSGGSAVNLTFFGKLGANYQLQGTPNVSEPGSWQALFNYVQTNGLIAVSIPMTNQMFYYRLLQQ
jgi:hypothetical protein